jgi:hypothetical protein
MLDQPGGGGGGLKKGTGEERFDSNSSRRNKAQEGE